MSPLNGKLVRRADEWQAGELGDLPGRGLCEVRSAVETGSDRRSAECKPINSLECVVDALQIVAEHPDVAGPFLPQGKRGCILHVSPADLHYVLPLGSMRGERI